MHRLNRAGQVQSAVSPWYRRHGRRPAGHAGWEDRQRQTVRGQRVSQQARKSARPKHACTTFASCLSGLADTFRPRAGHVACPEVLRFPQGLAWTETAGDEERW
jgi:hypothetical protein